MYPTEPTRLMLSPLNSRSEYFGIRRCSWQRQRHLAARAAQGHTLRDVIDGSDDPYASALHAEAEVDAGGDIVLDGADAGASASASDGGGGGMEALVEPAALVTAASLGATPRGTCTGRLVGGGGLGGVFGRNTTTLQAFLWRRLQAFKTADANADASITNASLDSNSDDVDANSVPSASTLARHVVSQL